MPAPLPTPTRVGGLGLLERAISYTLGSLLMVRPTDLGRATPCDEWDLRELLHHMNDSLATLHEAGETGHVDLSPLPPGSDLGALVESLRNRSCSLLGAWTSAPDRPIEIGDRVLSPGLVAATGAIEVAVHGWDVSAALGRPRELPPRLASALLEVALVLVSPGDRPGRFAVPVAMPVGASPSGRLLGWLGRDVRTASAA